MDSYDFERAVIAMLVEIMESRGMKHDPTAKKIWPDRKAAGRTWQAIRSEKTGQRLTLMDAHAIAHFLGVSMSQLCALVESQEIQNHFLNANHKKEKNEKRENPPPANTTEYGRIYKN